jgi:SAM-dependent methyltransferase
MKIKSVVKKIIPSFCLELRSVYARTRPLFKRECPICKWKGYFSNFGYPPRIDAQCPNCNSLERHRLFWLWYESNKNNIQSPILHFAPEQILEIMFRKIYNECYKTADLYELCDFNVNIENMNFKNETFSTIICNHVLEHVDDKKALSEIYRVLKPGGLLIVTVPIVEGWDKTYEDEIIASDFERSLHFGQKDHVRYYGYDFRDRLKSANFKLNEYTAEAVDVALYGLTRGEKIFICSKL